MDETITKYKHEITAPIIGLSGIIGISISRQIQQQQIPNTTDILTTFVIATITYYITIRIINAF